MKDDCVVLSLSEESAFKRMVAYEAIRLALGHKGVPVGALFNVMNHRFASPYDEFYEELPEAANQINGKCIEEAHRCLVSFLLKEEVAMDSIERLMHLFSYGVGVGSSYDEVLSKRCDVRMQDGMIVYESEAKQVISQIGFGMYAVVMDAKGIRVYADEEQLIAKNMKMQLEVLKHLKRRDLCSSLSVSQVALKVEMLKLLKLSDTLYCW